MVSTTPFHESLKTVGKAVGEPLPVTLSPELIGLLSEQLYRSPAKAIEELVVNAYDAEADEVRIFVGQSPETNAFIVVYDDGVGMTYEGLADLWKVGRPKDRDEGVYARKERKQIGKFGIGKLSTYAIANRVTYFTKADGKWLGVSIDYRDFVSNESATTTPVTLDVQEVEVFEGLWKGGIFSEAAKSVGIVKELLDQKKSCTFVILEDLKPKANDLKLGRLRWILRTAMPLGAKFRLFLNSEEVESSKEQYEVIVEFSIGDLPSKRLNSLKKKTGERWSAKEGALVSHSFPSGISGQVRVTKESLVGKSSDLLRSEGFFVYVRQRLVNEEDARFGLHELSHATLNRFRADVYADDLDAVVKANRESMEDDQLYRDAQFVLNEIFNEARQRYEDCQADQDKQALGTHEDKRNWVPERLVEYPTADALAKYSVSHEGTEADESWMYLDVDLDTDVDEITKDLYSRVEREQAYTYQYSALTSAGRLVEFDPSTSTFVINQDHELVLAYSSDPVARMLLQDVATAEALLEVYLREAGLSAHAVAEILQKRDNLFRGLANSQLFSLEGLATSIRDSGNRSVELEIAVVAGARALGFVATHVGGSGEPDGVARFTDFPGGEQKIILEAKSSNTKVSAQHIDFASIQTHMDRHNALGCLLVAPGYQGGRSGNVVTSANNLRISCWTVTQFADVIESAEARQISARQILDIVLKAFSPYEVSEAIEKLLAAPTWETRSLYLAVVETLRSIHDILAKTPRSVQLIAGEIAKIPEFDGIEESEIQRAVADLAGASQGGLLLRENDAIVLNVDYDELERRVHALTGKPGSPRRKGSFGQSE